MITNKHIINPLEFIGTIELFTVAMIASFASWKLLNAFYEDIYEPLIDIIIKDEHCNKYIIKTSDYDIRAGFLIKEFMKWLLIIISLMVIHNIYVYAKKN